MTTEPVPAPPPHRGRSLAAKFAIAFLLGVVLVAGAGGAGLYVYGQQYSGRILPGVSVGGTDLSGLTPEAATAAIADAYANLGVGVITLTGPNGEMTIGYMEIGRGPDTRAMLDAALAAGRRGEPLADLIGAPQTAIKGVVLQPAVAYDPAALESAGAAAAKTIDRDPVDATLTTAKDGSYVTTESVDGRVVDQQALLVALDAQLSKLDAPGEIRMDIPFTTSTPTTETSDVEAAAAAADRMAQDLVLTRAGGSWTIPGKDLRALISFQAAPDGSIAPVVDETGIDALIKPIAKAVNQKRQDPGFKYQGGHVVATGTSKEGRTIDVPATHVVVATTLAARMAGQADGQIEPAVAATAPTFTMEEAQAVAAMMRPLATGWTTWFPIWSHNGFGANIWVPASIIDGTVVNPGETFDFWKVVGEVNHAKGYRLGGAIINGRTQAQGAIGGGICSCSTTLFNAALRAGYKMGARRNHYYYIDRYPLGLDATVFISGGGSKQTMSWTNDTKYPVLIRGINTRGQGKGFVTFKLYSVPTHRTVSISAPTVKNIRPAGDSTEQSGSLRAGYSQRVEYPTDGKDVWRTVTVRENGKVIRRTTYYSHYSVVTGVVLIGTGGPTAPTSVP
jgi:vancomycin resistance protein YoaR